MAETIESSEFAPNDIILKRYSGEEKVFKGVDVVRLTHASNEYTVPYTFGEAVENIPITLDLKDGDQTVTAPEGTLVKSAVISKPVNLTPENIRSGKTIAGVTGEFVGESEPLIVGTSEGAIALDWSAGDQIITPATDGKPFAPVTLEKPATLLPENIAEGIDVAGIIGTLASGGANVKIAIGTCPYDITARTYNHNLGEIPDIIILIPASDISAGSTASTRRLFMYGISSKMASLYPGLPVRCSVNYKSSKWYIYQYTDPMEQATNSAIYNVTESTFSVPSYGVDFKFIAIAGLT